MKLLHENNEYWILEVDQCGNRIPDFVLIKVNDYTKTFRTTELMEKKFDRCVRELENALKVIEYAKDSLDHDLIDQAKAHLEIYEDFDIKKEVFKRV